ncbi:histidine kinase [Aureisphaera galaxeae]|uniref:sensor histidine kinase n=1 Tax=Aureisphaera galaxeae TaxID=1538023 RepID=UPI002350E98A|nr:histidine kinase [Aureisphaera galaxeae]MDC8002918.1 histidine kinase [Aureisphaera galaxeae]
MITFLKRNNWLPVKIIVLITIAVPMGITVYDLIETGENSVVFLGDYHPDVAMVVVIYYTILLLLGIYWIILQLKSLLKLKNENTKNELSHLKSQVNPHFFFNMLNNLYGMVDKDTEKSKALILKLSDLMRYSIYEGEKELVTLEEEVAYLQNYIELHKMRYHKEIDVQFHIDIKDEKIQLMPLLFIILLENAFKHGVENLRENAFVHISLHASHQAINFDIANNFDASELPSEKGIGLENLQRRLALAYPKKHTFTYIQEGGIFKAHLQLRK